MGNCCSGEQRNEETDRLTHDSPPKNFRVAAYEGRPDAFGYKVSTFFSLTGEQLDAVSKYGLHRGKAAGSSPIRQVVTDTFKYEGQISSQMSHGIGHLLNVEGDFVVGSFEEGKLGGNSVIYMKNGDYVQILEVKNIEDDNRYGSFNGRAIYTFKDGRKYDGDFKQGLKDGEGTYHWLNGSSYKGQWQEGHQHGHGIFVDAKGKKIEGEFANGRKIKKN